MKTNKRFILILIMAAFTLLLIFTAFVLFPGMSKQETSTTSFSTCINKGKMPLHDTTLMVNGRKVLIKICDNKKKGTFLMLQGWNLPVEDWYTKTSICQKAISQGYCIVLPDMGKSIYHEKVFPETRSDWRAYPTRKWLCDTLIPLLQKEYALLQEDDTNYLVGLSTGARGVALMLLEFKNLFSAAAALSGDYNQLKMPADNLMKGYYGTIDQYRERWTNTDNPINKIQEYQTPLYLGHGKLDKVVPAEQTRLFYDSLKKVHPKLKLKLHMPDAQHDYNYWESETDSILNFFWN